MGVIADGTDRPVGEWRVIQREAVQLVLNIMDARREYWQQAVENPNSMLNEDQVQSVIYELSSMRVKIGRAFGFDDPEWW